MKLNHIAIAIAAIAAFSQAHAVPVSLDSIVAHVVSLGTNFYGSEGIEDFAVVSLDAPKFKGRCYVELDEPPKSAAKEGASRLQSAKVSIVSAGYYGAKASQLATVEVSNSMGSGRSKCPLVPS